MFWRMKKEVPDLQRIIADLACHFLEHGADDSFRKRARKSAEGLKDLNLQKLRTMFHDPPEETEVYSVEKHGLGGWLSACQFSIFELIYNTGEHALPFLREVAWGVYDWTQGNAIELLIRLASEGTRREEIIAEIRAEFPNIRYEARLYAIQPLLSRLSSDPSLRLVFDELMSIDAFNESYEDLTDVDTSQHDPTDS